jgi:cycloeucalenol cycloisomerase
MNLWSKNPGKRAAQRLYLAYTPIWGAVCGAVMLTGLVSRWGDGPLLALGFGLWLVLLAAGLVFRAKEDRNKPWRQLYHVKLSAFVAVLAFTGNYFGTRYFYEILDMHYGFHAGLVLNDVPLFLYPLTAVYFTTYTVLLDVSLRAARSLTAFGWRRSLGGGRVAALLLCSFALAFLETGLNANPAMKSSFCYGNLAFALGFGTILYGLDFVIAGPLWHRIDERPGECTPLRDVVVSVLAASMLILCADELVEGVVAPHFTTVVRGRVGIPGKQGRSCLAAPDDS